MKLFLAIFFVAFSLINAQLSPDVSGPYEKCESKAKNVTVEESKAKYSDQLKPINFYYFDKETSWNLTDSTDFTPNGLLVINGSDFQGDYKLWKVRLVSSSKGSKHSLQSSPLELHLISYSETAKSFSTLVFLFKVVKDNNAALNEWLDDFKDKNAQRPWKLSSFIPSDYKVYYRYESKSVDSSCENIKWTIFESPISISSEQLSVLYKAPEVKDSVPEVIVKELFTSKKSDSQDVPVKHNNATPTDKGKNTVKQAKVPENSSNIANIAFSSLLAVLGLNLLFL